MSVVGSAIDAAGGVAGCIMSFGNSVPLSGGEESLALEVSMGRL
jgi:hypothetical protein